MNKKSIIQSIKELRANSPERKFSQSVDLIITLKDINLKNPQENVDFFMTLPAKITKKKKICAFAGAELVDSAKKCCDNVIIESEFDSFDKKAIKKLATEYDYFIAQANLMVKIAAKFGRILGTRGKMPNPKAGCVIPPKGNIQALVDKLQSFISLKSKKSPVVYSTVGTATASDEDIADNIIAIVDAVKQHLPGDINNIKDIYLKFTMSKPVKLGK